MKSYEKVQLIHIIDVMPKTVEEALATQRANIKFNPQHLAQFLYGKSQYAVYKQYLEEKPVFPFDMNMFNRGRVEILKETIKNMHYPYNNSVDYMSNDTEALYLLLNCLNQVPGSIHTSMFMRCINIMGDQSQIDEFIEKCKTYDIVGCYAQTQIAHGSDVSSLLTQATFDKESDQFIINTPGIKATKFWPGDLGLFSNHALVFANLILDNKKTGIQAFIVPIRDPVTMAPLAGVDVGDIGPKIGFPAKDNGYLILNNVRIPRRFMLSRFTKLTKDGKLHSQGDPKIGYATMMQIRKHICLSYPKIYTTAITIATRYSIFRQQFKNKSNEEIKIMDYQLQQEKILSRVAEYYAITISGNIINQLCKQNLRRVLDKADFSLMGETHICLSLGKPFMSQLVYDGMEICRRACGGHGFSTYSGFPFLINQYAANLTYEGENTVLYLQVARYLLKNYKKSMMEPDSTLPESVKYLKQQDLQTLSKLETPENLTFQHFLQIFSKTVFNLLSEVSAKMLSKQKSQLEIWNKQVGIKLKDLAVAHSVYYVFNNYVQKIEKEKGLCCQEILKITENLGKLFGINMLIMHGGMIIEAGCIEPDEMSIMRAAKQVILRELRPVIIGIVDGFGFPDKYIRSALISGNPYQNLLKLARQNQLNHERLPSVDVVKQIKNHMKNPNPKL